MGCTVSSRDPRARSRVLWGHSRVWNGPWSLDLTLGAVGVCCDLPLAGAKGGAAGGLCVTPRVRGSLTEKKTRRGGGGAQGGG